MTEFYKAIRETGASFNDPDFMWVPESDPVAGHIVTHPHAHRDDASGYLSVATVPTDCTGMSWPARLLIVEPVNEADVFKPDPFALPNKRAAHQWRVVREEDPKALLGPSADLFFKFMEEIPTRTPEQWDAARDAAWGAAGDAAGDAAWDAARDAAGDAARGAARDAAWGAAGDAAGDAAWGAARDAAWGAAWGVAWGAEAIALRDLIGTGNWTAEAYEVLVAPARAAGFTIPPAADEES